MGREIRRVPPGWEHPRDEQGYYRPLFDEDFQTAFRRWKKGFFAWEAGTHESLQRNPSLKDECEYWEFEGLPSDREMYRPKWSDEERTAYQIYETVSEGTPTSPVFETKEQMIRWLIEQGQRPSAAEAFAESGWVPSAVMVPQGGGNPLLVITGIDSADFKER